MRTPIDAIARHVDPEDPPPARHRDRALQAPRAALIVAENGKARDDALAKFRGGQACTAANRSYVHESVAFDFVARFADQVEQLKVGPGSDPTSDIGPLNSARALAGVRGLVEDAAGGGIGGRARARAWRSVRRRSTSALTGPTGLRTILLAAVIVAPTSTIGAIRLC